MLHTDVRATARASAANTDRLMSSAPTAAPANIARTAASLRCQRGLLPPAKEESAARPVMVSVNTVVVRSATPSFGRLHFSCP